MENENYMRLIFIIIISMVVTLISVMSSKNFTENKNNEFVYYYKGLD